MLRYGRWYFGSFRGCLGLSRSGPFRTGSAACEQPVAYAELILPGHNFG